tara:strand:- start:434 stop:1258 length:825 start_codon:yes stop_codon:yes gene_type:complete
MKKLLGLIFLMMFLNSCETGYSSYNYGTSGSYSSSSNFISDQQFIDSKLSDRGLSPIEGIWRFTGGRKLGIYKSGDSYIAQVLYSQQIPIGAKNFNVESTSDTEFFGSYYLYDPEGRQYEGYTEISVYGSSANIMIIDSQGMDRGTDRLSKSWPNDLSAHNSKYQQEKEQRIITNVNDRAQSECSDLGFQESSQDLANCKLKLITLYKKESFEEEKIRIAKEQTKAAKLQAFAAKRQAAAQQQIANIQRQQNSRTLMNQGMKMLSGGCTLGIDC